MIENIYHKPNKITPSMEKYEGRFKEKSSIPHPKNISPSLNEGVNKYSIVEWDDGWLQFNVTKNQFVIHSIYAEKDYEYKFSYVYKLAKALNKKEIIFETERNPKAWIKLIDNVANKLNNNSKTRVKSYTLSVEVD